MTASLRVCTGTGAGTESAAVAGIALLSVDAATNDPDDHRVVPGTNSYEKWLRVRVDSADGIAFSDFWIERTGALPDGAVIKVGTTDTPATPTAATSAVARTTMAEGRHYTFDAGSYDETGDATRYVVLQLQVAAAANSGAIAQQAFSVGWHQS